MNKIVEAFNRGYTVSIEGTAYNKKGKKVGYINTNIDGYKSYLIRIRVNKKVVNVPIHRLQAFQKYGHKMFEQNIMVRHLDGNSLNNSWDNIAIGTNSDNMMDIPKQIRIKKALHASSFVKKYNKKEVQDFHSINRSYKETMKHFNISSKGTLNYILNN